MAPRVFGLETEYALAELRSGGRRSEHLIQRLMEVAAKRLPHLPGHNDAGLFLVNGSRFYLDVGGHPELATPEVQDPWEAVRYVKAGDRILLDLVAAVQSESPNLEPLLMRGNVDYSGRGTTWGCHESYLHASKLESGDLAVQLIPHLVSRIVFAGAGGFKACSPGIEFTLSPRAWHLRQAVSGSSTDNRGIFHTRDESLCGPGYRRLHLLCGDSLCSETSLWLTVATTALVVALIEAGKTPGTAVRLLKPVAVLRRFAADPTLRAAVTLADERRATAISIQRHYLEQAERHVGSGFMPVWAEDVCNRWRLTLDQLEYAPHETARTLDWPIKLGMFRERLGRSSLDAEQIAHWNALLDRPHDEEAARPVRPRVGRLTTAERIRMAREGAHPAESVEARLNKRGIPIEAAEEFLALRAELMEMETRYGALGVGGTFAGLDEAGVLRHRVVFDEEIETARGRPPAAGRAHLRGEAVRRLAKSGKSSCHWSQVWDGVRSRMLDLSNPFETKEKWRSANGRTVISRWLSRRSEGAPYRIFDDLDPRNRYDRP